MHNDRVQIRLRCGVLAVMGIGLCLSGAAQNQTHDSARSRVSSPVPDAARVDLNHASLEELLRIPGMTRVWATRIVRFRPYRTKGALLDHGVLSDEAYDRIKEYVVAHRE